MKKKYKNTKIGAVLNMGKGPFIVLGDEKNANPKWIRNVQIRVLDGEGNVLTQVKNGTLSLFDPRKTPGKSEEAIAKVPKAVQYELVISEEVKD